MEGVFYIGLAAYIIGNIWLIVRAFGEGILWGLGTLFLPFVGLIFAIVHWATAKVPFLLALGGISLCVISALLGNPGAQAVA